MSLKYNLDGIKKAKIRAVIHVNEARFPMKLDFFIVHSWNRFQCLQTYAVKLFISSMVEKKKYTQRAFPPKQLVCYTTALHIIVPMTSKRRQHLCGVNTFIQQAIQASLRWTHCSKYFQHEHSTFFLFRKNFLVCHFFIQRICPGAVVQIFCVHWHIACRTAMRHNVSCN